MPFSRFVEIGRVVYVVSGPEKGKLATIIDVIDQNRALVHGPKTDVKRQSINFKQLHLTKFVVKIPRSPRMKTLNAAWEKADVSKKWEESAWAKKIAAKERRAELTDFERFKLMRAKQARNRLINIEFGKLRKVAKKSKPTETKKRRVKKPSKK